MTVAGAWRAGALAAALALAAGVAACRAPAAWLAHAAAALSGGRVLLEGVEGPLAGPVQLRRARLELGGMRLEARGVELDWSPEDLLRARLAFRRIEAAEVDVHLPRSAAPALPYTNVSIDGLRVGSLRLLRGEAVATLQDVRGAVVEERTGERALAMLAGGWRGRPLAARAGLNACGEGAGEFRSGLEAAAAHLPKGLSLSLSAAEVDVSALRPGSAPSRLRVSLEAVADGRGGLAGHVEVGNPDPGSLDAGRLPLARAGADFRLAAGSWYLEHLEADLAAAGRVSGSGSLAAGQGRWQLALQRLDLRGLHSGLPVTALEGTAQVETDEAGERLSVQAREQGASIDAELSRSGERLTARALRVAAHGAVLEASGELVLDDALSFRAEGVLSGVDSTRFGALPPAVIGADFSAAGQARPALQARLDFALRDSVLFDAPLAGEGALALTGSRIGELRLDLSSGENTLSASGSLGAAGDRLEWTLSAPDLGSGGIAARGRLSGEGSMAGEWAALSAAFRLSAHDLAWEGFALASLAADGTLERAGEGPFRLDLTLAGLRHAGLQVEQLVVEASGTKAEHRAAMQAQLFDSRMSGALQGSWTAQQGWLGRVENLESAGAIEFRLLEPARVALADGGVTTDGVRARVFGGELDLAHLQAGGGKFASRGSLSGVRAAAALGGRLPVRGDLRMGARWDLAFAEGADGEISIWREDGDLVLAGLERHPLALERLTLEGRISAGDLRARLDLAAAGMGSASGSVRMGLARSGAGWRPDRASALELDAAARIDSLQWLPMLLEEHAELHGSGSVRVQGRGTVGAPVLTGEAGFDGLGVTAPDLGLELREGRLRAVFQQDELRLTEFSVRGGEGDLRATGSMDFGDPDLPLTLDARASRLTAINRPDRGLVTSGTLHLAMARKALELSGQLEVDRGFVELAPTTGVEVSSDVVVLGRPAAEERARRLRAKVDVLLDLGENFRLRGSGVDAGVSGRLRLRDAGSGPLEAFGTVRLGPGTLEAFGQQLVITRGTAAFSGPLDAPALDLVAIREDTPDRVGVELTGTAARPVLRLVADAPMTDSQKLSWITLGGAAEDASSAERGGLQAALGAFLAYGAGAPAGGIGRAFGLDQLAIGSRYDVGTVLTLGKRLSERVYVAYEQSLTEASGLFKIQYELSRRWSLRLRAGYEDAADLHYRLSFD